MVPNPASQKVAECIEFVKSYQAEGLKEQQRAVLVTFLENAEFQAMKLTQ